MEPGTTFSATKPHNVWDVASWMTCIRTRPEPCPRTSTATMTSAALAVRLRPPRRPASRPRPRIRPLPLHPRASCVWGPSWRGEACAEWSTLFDSGSGPADAGAERRKCLAFRSSSSTRPRTTTAAAYASCAALSRLSATSVGGSRNIPKYLARKPARLSGHDSADTRSPSANDRQTNSPDTPVHRRTAPGTPKSSSENPADPCTDFT